MEIKELQARYYFNLKKFEHKELFENTEYVWESLKKLPIYIESKTKGKVIVGTGTIVEPNAIIKGPAIIGENCEIRSGAYIRENVIIGNNCVVRSEIKNSIIMDNSNAAHLSYLGDSIVGQNCNLGAGTILSNLKLNEQNIIIKLNEREVDTGMNKLGAIIGDSTHTGCNVVTNPGTLIGPNSFIYSNAVLGGFYPKNQIIKLRQNLEIVEKD